MGDAKKTSIVGNTCHLLNIKNPERTNKRIKFTFQRLRATLALLKSGNTSDVSVSLLDISEQGVGFFSSQLMLKGASAELIFTEPCVLKLTGTIAWSVPIKSGIHKSKFGFRTGMQFQFENDFKRAALIDFIQKVSTESVTAFHPIASAPPLPGTGLVDPAAPTTAPVASSDPAAANAAPADPNAPAPGAVAPADANTAPSVAPAADGSSASTAPAPAAPVDATAAVNPAAPPSGEATNAAPQVASAPDSVATLATANEKPPGESEGSGQSQAA